MARQINRLNSRTADSLKKPGRHADGGGLYLVITKSGARSWMFLFRAAGRLREMGLGSTQAVSLAKARELASRARAQVAEGVDPIEARRADRSKKGDTFREVAEALHATKKGGWRNERYNHQWLNEMERHCGAIWTKHVADIGVADILAVLRPIWSTKSATASRLRGRLEQVLDAAKVQGLVAEDRSNPARWKANLAHLLSRQPKLKQGHLAAMNFTDVPEFVAELRSRMATTARCLEFLILTAGRSGEVLGARWAEIDRGKKLWVIPASRMKGGVEHRVPLCARAIEILDEMVPIGNGHEFVFPGTKQGTSLSSMSLLMLIRRMKRDITVHGFRSSFRDWCGELTAFPRDLAEIALAHLVGNQVERSYRRGDAIERRRQMMQAWADYCSGEQAENVVQLRRSNE